MRCLRGHVTPHARIVGRDVGFRERMAPNFRVRGVVLCREDLNMVPLMMYPVDLRESTGLFTVIKIPMDKPFKNGSKYQGDSAKC